MPNYLLPEDLRNDLIAYLGDRPYREVASGMTRLLKLEKAPEPEKEAPHGDEPNNP